MRKFRNRTRQRYHVQYRWLRLNGGIPDGSHSFNPNEEADECACLSFDWRDSNFSGWINYHRRTLWAYRKSAVGQHGGLPF